MEGTRRLFLKRAATGLGVAWAAPAITTIDVSRAQGASAPPLAAGRAFGVQALGNTITIDPPEGDTGPQPGSFTQLCSDPFHIKVPPSSGALARVRVVEDACGSTAFSPTEMQARADVIDLRTEGPAGAPAIRVDSVIATATAPTNCTVAPFGSVVIDTLKVAGSAVTVTGDPNQTILWPNSVTPTARLVINEQLVECRNDAGVDHEYFVVNALHLFVPAIGLPTHELIVGHAEASMGCTC